MMKIMYSILVLIIFVSFIQQPGKQLIQSDIVQLTNFHWFLVSSQSLKRCRRATSSACVLTPELTEGPYYWNTSAMRQNIS